MWKNFSLQARRLSDLRHYKAVITSSAYMKHEYLKHGLATEKIHVAPIYLPASEPQRKAALLQDAWRLMFVGRFTRLKGGHLILDALPLICPKGKKVVLTFVGDGPERAIWEKKAAELEREHPSLRICFEGWKAPAQVHSFLEECDLLIVPSVWPEPYGIVGLEAGRHGVPVAAFDVGGISEWLKNGINGYLAPSDPPTADGLAKAVTKCLSASEHARLQKGALELSKNHTGTHVRKIVEVFESVIAHG